MLHDCTDTKYIECCEEEGEEGKVEMWEGDVAGGGGAMQRGRWEKGREGKEGTVRRMKKWYENRGK